MVDEAHGLGVFGKQGRGVCDYFGVTDDVDLIMGTFSKSLASIGGFIAGDKDTINYLRHTCRTYIFSASNTPAATAAAMEALHIIKNEPERIERLWDVTKYALRRFKEEGFEIGDTESPIIPLYVRDVSKTFLVTKAGFRCRSVYQSGNSSGVCSSRHSCSLCLNGDSHARTGRKGRASIKEDICRTRHH